MNLSVLTTPQLEGYRAALESVVSAGTFTPETLADLHAVADEMCRRTWDRSPAFPAWLQYDAFMRGR